VGFAAATVFEPVEARAGGSEPVVQIADETAYLMFVDHPTPPNTTYNVRGNFTAVAYEEWVHGAFADGKQYVIPRGRVVCMATEEIR